MKGVAKFEKKLGWGLGGGLLEMGERDEMESGWNG